LSEIGSCGDWQRHLFEHGAAAFGESRKRAETSSEQELLAENERLKARLARKDEVIATRRRAACPASQPAQAPPSASRRPMHQGQHPRIRCRTPG